MRRRQLQPSLVLLHRVGEGAQLQQQFEAQKQAALKAQRGEAEVIVQKGTGPELGKPTRKRGQWEDEELV